MAVSFPKPNFVFNYDVSQEIESLKEYRDNKPGRKIPKKSSSKVLVASWNIANLGLQQRYSKDYELISELISWFDIIAIQEVYDNLSGIYSIKKHLPNYYSLLFSDKGGNNERAAFIYDTRKISLMEKVGEVAVPPSDYRFIKLEGVTQKYKGFDRNPYLAAFKAGNFKFLLVNVHLFFGDDNEKDRQRRALEAYAVSRWGDLRRKSPNRYVDHVIVLGDFNLPKVEPGDLIYKALKKRGLRRPRHSSQIASNIANDKDYDQLMFFPGETKHKYTGETGIFDFDGAVFSELWETKTRSQFRSYVRYHLSDHRIIWAEFEI